MSGPFCLFSYSDHIGLVVHGNAPQYDTIGLRIAPHWCTYSSMATPMRMDIRPALRDRLESIDAELVDLTRRREQLAALRSSVEATLNHEEALHGNADEAALAPAIHPTPSGQSLSDLILRLLDGQPMTLEQLKNAGAGWPLLQGKDFPGRAINFALVGLQKGGYVERLENGAWQKISGSNRK
jgi:hypothetical protein